MFSTLGPVPEFVRVVQIVCWIALPAFAVVTVFIVYQHYRKIRKNRMEALSVRDLPMPAAVAQLNRQADFILFDHSGLVKQYHQKLCHSEARYAALQHKLAALRVKCAAMAVFAAGGQTNASNVSSYAGVKREVDRFIKKYNWERKRSEALKDQLMSANQQLRQENQRLRAALDALNAASQAPVLAAAAGNVA